MEKPITVAIATLLNSVKQNQIKLKSAILSERYPCVHCYRLKNRRHNKFSFTCFNSFEAIDVLVRRIQQMQG